MILISVSLTLIALTGGTFLLAKAKKDGLGIYYKFMAWFVIIASILTLLCCGMMAMAHMYGKHQMHDMHWKKDKKAYKKYKKRAYMYQHKMKSGGYTHEGKYKNDCCGEMSCGMQACPKIWKRQIVDTCIEKVKIKK
jgi:hypothetical protein